MLELRKQCVAQLSKCATIVFPASRISAVSIAPGVISLTNAFAVCLSWASAAASFVLLLLPLLLLLLLLLLLML